MTSSQQTDVDRASAELAALRADIPLMKEVAFFQTGSLAPLATPVRAAIIDALDHEGERALHGPAALGSLHDRAVAARSRVASFVGAQPEELAWTVNTTTSIRFAIGSLDWRAGDRLLTTNHEHISTRALQAGLRDRYGAETIVANAAAGPDQLLTELETALRTEPRIRLLLTSHVSCQDGRRLPVEEVVRLGHAHDVAVMVDGAQSLGQFPIDLNELGCDMLVGSAHKWLLGPAGLGFLYVARSGLPRFRSGFAMAPNDPDAAEPDAPRPLASRVEMGTQGSAGAAGLAAAVERLDRIGLVEIERHARTLTDRLFTGLRDLPGVTIATPTEPEQRTGLSAFTIEGYTHDRLRELTAALWEREQVVAKVQIEQPSIRVSIAAFNTADDIDRLLRALTTQLTRR